MKTVLENTKVKVLEEFYEPGVPRKRFIRPTDQVIVFLDDCRYQRTDRKAERRPSASAKPSM